mmetsp:Transcript_30184/g.83289  ORF Transcript_30184/g.83289 Transcript_30184/m.83289 type:complete len:281 (+) Transcript_30184:1701-2543(+)
MTSGSPTSRDSSGAMGAASWSGPATCLSRPSRRSHQSLLEGSTCSTRASKRSTVLRGMPWPSTTVRHGRWRSRTCTRCTASCSARLPSCLARHVRGRSMIRPLRSCHTGASRTLVSSMRRWKRCLEKSTVHAQSMSMHPSFVTPGRRTSSGRYGEGLRFSTGMRTPSETCYESRGASRRCLRRCTSTQPTSQLRAGQRSWTPCKQRSRPSGVRKTGSGRQVVPWAATPRGSGSRRMPSLRARSSWRAFSHRRPSRVHAMASSSSSGSRALAIMRMRALQS